jgi:N-acyl homoserine lactone hydrolase
MKFALLLSIFLAGFGSIAEAGALPQDLRLYALDCGQLTFKDISMFSDTGYYDGQSGSMVDPCFLVKHPSGYFLWDTGLGDALVGHDVPANEAGVSLHVQTRMTDQLSQIGIKPADVKILAFSHFHSDHTGNANAFPGATWIINERELKWALQKPTPPIVRLETFNAYRNAHTRMISGDYDVFGDGSVRILKAPGHTPGLQVLLLKLTHSGTVLLSGDLYHMESDRPGAGSKTGQVLASNTDRAQTLASMDRFESLAQRLHARVVVQHDPKDFRALPAFPAYLD